MSAGLWHDRYGTHRLATSTINLESLSAQQFEVVGDSKSSHSGRLPVCSLTPLLAESFGRPQASTLQLGN